MPPVPLIMPDNVRVVLVTGAVVKVFAPRAIVEESVASVDVVVVKL
jgi:hypothetical protein